MIKLLMIFKFIGLFILAIFAGMVAEGQTCPTSNCTQVSVTVVDSAGQVWTNGQISFQFQGNGQFNGQYQWNNANLPNQYLAPTVMPLDGSGSATFFVPSTDQIFPSGGAIAYTVCPNASVQCQTVAIGSTGSTQNISSNLTSNLPAISLAASSMPIAYNSSQIKVVPRYGGLYYDATQQVPMYYNGSIWQPFGGGLCEAGTEGQCVVTQSPGTQIIQLANSNSFGWQSTSNSAYYTLANDDGNTVSSGDTYTSSYINGYSVGAGPNIPTSNTSIGGWGLLPVSGSSTANTNSPTYGIFGFVSRGGLSQLSGFYWQNVVGTGTNPLNTMTLRSFSTVTGPTYAVDLSLFATALGAGSTEGGFAICNTNNAAACFGSPTITINGTACTLGGSCTPPSSGNTTINGTACALNGSCSISTAPARNTTNYSGLGTRVGGTIYHNSSATQIMLVTGSLQAGSAGTTGTDQCSISSDGTTFAVQWQDSKGSIPPVSEAGFHCEVPPLFYYEITATGGISQTQASWWETLF